jgi:hypothetical protein
MALDADVNPLSDPHCDCLNEVLASAMKTKQLAEACKACGLDVAGAESQNNAQIDLATKLKQVFFPNRQ